MDNFWIQNFMTEMRGGARPNQFYVEISLPTALSTAISQSAEAEDKLRFMAQGSSLPASSIGQVPVPFRGTEFKVEGDRTFGDWNMTVLNDNDFLIRDSLEQWHDSIVGYVNHDQPDITVPLDYMGTGTVNQLDKNSNVLKVYTFIGIWPTDIGEIALSWDSNNQVEVFDATFAVQWFEPERSARNATEGVGIEGLS